MPVETPRDWTDRAEDDGLYAIACALMALTRAMDRLGNADAMSSPSTCSFLDKGALCELLHAR
jgi:hypothetical protein